MDNRLELVTRFLDPLHPDFDLLEFRKTLRPTTGSDHPEPGVEFSSDVPGLVTVTIEVRQNGGQGSFFGLTYDLGPNTHSFGGAAAHVSEDGKTIEVRRNSMTLPLRSGETFVFVPSKNMHDVRFFAHFIPFPAKL